MEGKDRSLQSKLLQLRNAFAHRDSFTTAEAELALGKKTSTTYWTMWNLARNGYVHKIGKGLYTLQKKDDTATPRPSSLAIEILHILEETGYRFFISGLDILSIFMQHIPERYPVLLYSDRYSLDEIRELLLKNSIIASSRETEDLQLIERAHLIKGIALLRATNEFAYANTGLATIEKAFVDLYFEVTRQNYPLSMQELTRIYSNMRRRIDLDSGRLVKIASRRSIQADMRYIVESGLISRKAREFVDLLERQE